MKELSGKGFDENYTKKLFSLCNMDINQIAAEIPQFPEKERLLALSAHEELTEFFTLLKNFNHYQSIRFEPKLARGLDYYTGLIFETKLPDFPHIGSLSGGGRYDGLVGIFMGEDVPAVGVTVGLDRILVAAHEAGIIEKQKTMTDVLVAYFDSATLPHSLNLVSKLRDEGINAEMYLEKRKMANQFTYADKCGIAFVSVIGTDEAEKGTVRLKNMKTGESVETDIKGVIEIIKRA